MIHATIDVDLRDHEKAVKAGAGPMGLWTWGMLHEKKHMTSGRLSRDVVMRCPWTSGREEAQALADKLVEAGLWVASKDGWTVYNHAKKNESKEQIEARIEAKRKADRDRQSRKRQTKEVARPSPKKSRDCRATSQATPVVGEGDVDVAVAVVALTEEAPREPGTAEPEQETPVAPPSSGLPAHQRYAHAYAAGQRDAGATEYPIPDEPRHHGHLASLATDLGAKRGEAEGKIREVSAAFRRARPAAGIWTQGWSPEQCRVWLRQGRAVDPPESGTRQTTLGRNTRQQAAGPNERQWESAEEG